MACGDFEQYRFCEQHTIPFDSSGNPTGGTFDLSQALDLARFGKAILSITVAARTNNTILNIRSAPVNNTLFYFTNASVTVDSSFDSTKSKQTVITDPSRFLFITASYAGSGSATSLTVTIDVLARVA
jgi:hypothetical protein